MLRKLNLFMLITTALMGQTFATGPVEEGIERVTGKRKLTEMTEGQKPSSRSCAKASVMSPTYLQNTAIQLFKSYPVGTIALLRDITEKHDDPEFWFLLACCYMNDNATINDPIEAEKTLIRIGSRIPQDKLYLKIAQDYRSGQRILPFNPQKAIQAWEESSRLGNPEAQYILGKACETGLTHDGKVIVKQDLKKALEQYTLASAKGYQTATDARQAIVANKLKLEQEQQALEATPGTDLTSEEEFSEADSDPFFDLSEKLNDEDSSYNDPDLKHMRLEQDPNMEIWCQTLGGTLYSSLEVPGAFYWS